MGLTCKNKLVCHHVNRSMQKRLIFLAKEDEFKNFEIRFQKWILNLNKFLFMWDFGLLHLMYDVRRGNKFLISLSLFIKGLRNKIKISKNNVFLNDLQNIEFFFERVCLFVFKRWTMLLFTYYINKKQQYAND